MSNRTILHCDMNNFYASVEICKNPSLADKPIAVCGDPTKRHGIILAKSYPAKAFGIKTGDVIWEALNKCPQLILLPPDFSAYAKYSNIVFDIYTRYTDRVEPYGMDECWLDVTGSTKLFGSGKEIGDTLRRVVKEETGLTISVGVSFTKVLAKLGSDMKKPDATTVLDINNFKKIIWDLPAEEIIMVGRKTKRKLNKLNINTIGELANADRVLIREKFGIVGTKLVNNANGIDTEDVRLYYDTIIPKSVGHSTTTPRDMHTRQEVKSVIYTLSDQIAYRLRRLQLATQGVSLSTKNKNLQRYGRQTTLNLVTNNGHDIAQAAMQLFDTQFSLDIPLRAISVSTFHLVNNSDIRQCYFFEQELTSKHNLDTSIDSIKARYGIKSIKRATELQYKELTDIFNDEEFLPFKR